MKTFEQFMNQGADDKDPYWGLFEINKVANQAVLNAVEYGYKKAEEQAQVEITRLNKMVFDLQNAAIEMVEKLDKGKVLYEFCILDENELGESKIKAMAYETALNSLHQDFFEAPFFKVILDDVNHKYATPEKYATMYHFMVIQTKVSQDEI